MDDRRFDSLVKSLAAKTNRRSLVRGLLGLGGLAVVGRVAHERDADAARRPTPTPRPLSCPGRQTPVGGQCQCLAPPAPGPQKCGPDCCNPAVVGPAHSECCDNACCFGTCYGEELCCPTNPSGSVGQVPPTHKLCEGANGTSCCLWDQLCCDGACVDGDSCQPTGCAACERAELDCCLINDQFVGCYDAGDPDACCTADTCGLEDFPNCLTSLCREFTCEQVSTCEAGQYCCEGECSDLSCDPEQSCERCREEGQECCFINDEFVGCYDTTDDAACCTAADCETYNDPANCQVGVCREFTCAHDTSCGAWPYCCEGECSSEACEPV